MRQVSQAAHKKNAFRKQVFFFEGIQQVLGFFFFLAAIAVTIWGVQNFKAWINNPNREVLSQLVLNGDLEFTTENDIRTAIGEPGLLDTYVGQNVHDIQREIIRLPWLKQVAVQKQWPNKLIIYLSEYKPMFYWNDLFLLDNDGNVFSIPFERLANLKLPKLYGPENKEKTIVETYNRLNNIYQQQENKQFTIMVRLVAVDERNAWQLVITPCVQNFCNKNWNMKLLLGNEHIEQRYQKFLKLYPEIRKRTGVNERVTLADLRYENGIAVQKKNL